MLTFPDAWRFDSPGALEPEARRELAKLAKQIATQGSPWEAYEAFKANFAAAIGSTSSQSSSSEWAETDMFSQMGNVSNAPLFIQAFYDTCEQLRAAGRSVPEVAYLNKILERTKAGYQIRPPKLLQVTTGSTTPEEEADPPNKLKSDLERPASNFSSAIQSPPPAVFDKPTCFVIQPFDRGRFDKRFAEVFVPAIKAAGLNAYRVDKDITALTPIESIEDGIRAAVVCLADITTDNPNVWYELGYAYACGTPVVMVCAEVREGKQYPFDIQHRSVFTYAADSPGDFVKLEAGITDRLKAAMKKGAAIIQLADAGQVVAQASGLSQPEMTVMALLAGSITRPGASYRLSSLRQECERAGLTAVGVTMGIVKLSSKKFVASADARDPYNDEEYEVLRIEEKGWQWMEDNADKFSLLKARPEYFDDKDIPF